MIQLLSVLAVVAFAAPTREVEREQPSAVNFKANRYTDGFLSIGTYIRNHGNASARPDGSGTALTRTQVFIRDRGSSDQMRFLANGVFLTDRRKIFSKPASVDYYLAMARAGDGGNWMQVGRGEALALDIKGPSSRFWDFRFGSASHGDGGSFGTFVGWYFHNSGRPARPDRSGAAYLRYSAFIHARPGAFRLRLDADLLTDRDRKRYRPASFDFKAAVGVALAASELYLSWEPWVAFDGDRHKRESYLFTYLFRFDSRTSDVPHHQ